MDNYWQRAQRRATRRRFLAGGSAATVGAAGLLIAGCGDDDDDGGETVTATATGTATSSGGTTATATASVKQLPTGELTMALVSLSDQSTDPHRQTSGGNFPLIDSCFEQFSRRDKDGKLVPQLASSIEEPPDHSQLIVKLRPGATFWDGTPVTSEDVKWSYERILGLTPVSPQAGPLKRWVASVETPDPQTVIINIAEKNTQRLRGTVNDPQGWNIASKAYHAKVGEDAFIKKPMATGPYQIVESQQLNFAKLEAYAGHYMFSPGFKTITMKIVPEQATRVAQLQTGEAAFIDGIGGPARQQLSGNKDLKIYEVASTNHFGIKFTGVSQQAPYNDKRLRLALRYAIDQQAIIKSLLGTGTVSPPIYSVGPVTPGWNEKRIPPAEYNKEKAKQLLNEAGLSGAKVKLYSYDSSGTPLIPQQIQAAAGMWSDIGINAEIEVQENAAYLGNWRAGKLNGLAPVSGPATFVTEALFPAHYRSNATYPGAQDPKIDEMIDKAVVEFDEAKQRQLFEDFFAYMADEAWLIGFPWVPSQWAVDTRKIAGWTPAAGVSYPNSFWTLQPKA